MRASRTELPEVMGPAIRAADWGDLRSIVLSLPAGTDPPALVEGPARRPLLVGTGEPVLLIHGALIAEAYEPLYREPALAGYRLVRFHRRGYAGSSRATAPFSIAQQAADARALLGGLGIERAHVVGHASGGAIALQLALDAPNVVHSVVLLEPGLLDVPSGPLLVEALAPSFQLYQAGRKEEAAPGTALCQRHEYNRVS